MRANKHLLLWTSLATLLLLVAAAWQENFAQEWRDHQTRYAALQGAAGGRASDVRLRQVVQPELKAIDRCVSCHVGMAAGETGILGDKVLGPHPGVVHDPKDFGCVVCHAGQGRATETAAAHGTAPHWPEPMIPKKYAWAGCGSCHTHVAVPNRDQLARGRALYERHDCLACHRIEGRGGTLRPGGAGGLEGPDLSRAGAAGFREDWYPDHSRRHAEAQAAKASSPWGAAFGDVPAEDRAAIEVYLGAQVGVPQLVAAKALFHSLGCRGCHKVNGVGGDDGPDLTHEGERDPGLVDYSRVSGEHTWANWLSAHFRDPAAVVAGSKMPDFALDDAQIDSLVFYMLSLRRTDVPEAYWPRDRAAAVRMGQREFATDGATLFTTFCAACHGADGQGVRYPGTAPFPAIGNADFLAVASDRFLRETILGGRAGRRMPAWGEGTGGLRPAEIDAIAAWLRARAGAVASPVEDEPPRWVAGDAAAGGQLFARHCAGCHGVSGEGLDAPQVANARLLASATDRYLVETIRRGRRGTAMEGFGQGSTVRPALADDQIEDIVTFLRAGFPMNGPDHRTNGREDKTTGKKK